MYRVMTAALLIVLLASASAPAEIGAKVSTLSGNINIVTPSSFSGQVELETFSGSVKTSLPIMIKGGYFSRFSQK